MDKIKFGRWKVTLEDGTTEVRDLEWVVAESYDCTRNGKRGVFKDLVCVDLVHFFAMEELNKMGRAFNDINDKLQTAYAPYMFTRTEQEHIYLASSYWGRKSTNRYVGKRIFNDTPAYKIMKLDDSELNRCNYATGTERCFEICNICWTHFDVLHKDGSFERYSIEEGGKLVNIRDNMTLAPEDNLNGYGFRPNIKVFFPNEE